MSEKKKVRKTKWLGVRFWLRLFDEGIGEENADLVLARLASLREMVESGKAGRKAASKAIQNAMRACSRFTTSQVFAERVEYQQKKNKKEELRQPTVC